MSAGNTRDPRYDMVWREPNLSDPTTGYQVNTANGDLPLMLVESGSLGFTVGLTSPYGGRLSQGDLQDADLSQYTARTQRDWQKGRATLEAFAVTEAYWDGTANTLVPGMIIAGPYINTAFTNFTSPTSSSSDIIVCPPRYLQLTSGSPFYILPRGKDVFRTTPDSSSHPYITASSSVAANPVTATALFSDRIYYAEGDANDMEYMTCVSALSAHSTETGIKGTYLLSYNGYLYALKTSGEIKYYNGTAWSSAIQIGRPGYQTFTGLAGFNNQVIFAATNGLFSISADIPYQVYSYQDTIAATNGRNLTAWVADGKLYVPVQDKLMSYDGSSMTQVWPDPNDDISASYQGPVSFIATTQRLMFIAIDGGSSGYSSIYCKTVAGGWCKVYTSSSTGKRIQAMGVLSTQTANTQFLHFYENGTPYYFAIIDEFLDLSRSFVDPPFAESSTLTSSWIGTELRRVDKQVAGVVVMAEDKTAVGFGTSYTPYVDIELEFDRTGIWSTAGTVTLSAGRTARQYELNLSQPTISTTVSSYSSSTPSVTVASASGISAGQFIRIGKEVRQVTAIASNTLTLQRAFDTTPSSGDYVRGSLPVAKEFRYRATLRITTGYAPSYDGTPLVRAVTLKYQDMLIDKYRFTAQIKLEDGTNGRMVDNLGGQHPYTAAQLRSKLYEWAKRATPFRMIAPTGDLFTVKIANMNESQFSKTSDANTAGSKSVMIVSLIEA